MSKLFPFLLLAFFSLCLNAQTVYQWTDENGNVHFSDQAVRGSKSLKIDVTPPITSGPLASTKSKTKSANHAQQHGDFQVNIVHPQNGDTLRDNQGSIKVLSTTTPRVPSDFRYRLLLNGQAQGELHSNGAFQLTNVDRGEHQLVIELLSDAGKKIASSPAITVYLHRTKQSAPSTPPANGN